MSTTSYGASILFVGADAILLPGDDAATRAGKAWQWSGDGTTLEFGPGFGVEEDTESTLLQSSPAGDAISVATDVETGQLKVWSGGQWRESSAYLYADNSMPDIGLESHSNPAGYGVDYISSKGICNCHLGGNTDERSGAIRARAVESSIRLDIHDGTAWQPVTLGVSITRVDTRGSEGVYLTDYAHRTISLIDGNSLELADDGEPIVQAMRTSIGIYYD